MQGTHIFQGKSDFKSLNKASTTRDEELAMIMSST
jgi:hypothetical protein